MFSGGDAIADFLDEFDGWLSESVTIYLLGGSAMTVRGLEDQTEDIDLAFGVVSEFEYVYQILQEDGFAVISVDRSAWLVASDTEAGSGERGEP